MLLVHVAGVSDLGVDRPTQADNILKPTDSGWQELVNHRLAELNHCTTSEAACLRLFDLHYDCATQESANKVLASGSRSITGSPLAKELQGVRRKLADIADAGIMEESTEVVVIGVESSDGETASLALAIARALSLTLDQVSQMIGRPTIVHSPCILPTLSPDKRSMEQLETTIGEHNGHVILPLGGGATTVLIEAAGVAAATHPDEWSLVLVDRAAEVADGVAPIIDLSLTEIPIRGWLMGLGLPTVLDDQRGQDSDAEAREAAEAVRRALGSNTAPDAKDLAQLVLADTARGDMGAGMAIRAWIVAEYRARRDQHLRDKTLAPRTYPDATQNGGTLGRCIGRLKRRLEGGEHLEEPDRWLISQERLNDLGKRATHNLDPLEGDSPSIELRQAVLEEVGSPPPWLSWPAPEVCLLTGQGYFDPTGDRRHIVENLMSEAPPNGLRRACSVPEDLALSALLACSEDTVTHGETARHHLEKTFIPHDRWRLRDGGIEVMSYGASTTASAGSSETIGKTMRQVRKFAERWLDDRPIRPRAVVVAVTGEKPVAIALLMAAQRFGAKWGVPVFLTSSVRDDEGVEHFHFHQFGLDRDVRDSLLDAARHCIERFDLLTASRLLALGDPQMERLSESCSELSDELVSVVRTQDLDAHLPRVLDIWRVVAELIDGGVPEDARQRLATITAEILSRPRYMKLLDSYVPAVTLNPAEAPPGRKHGQPKGDADILKESAGALLRLLIQIRNKIPLNHGNRELAEVTKALLWRYRQADTFTYSDLLGATIDAIALEYPDTAPKEPGKWAARFRGVLDDIGSLRTRQEGGKR